ncbi:MAG TPA: right-handed parallel beta-helix repeat-containing protein, partial [Pseudonocardiaceae bacterium]
MSLMTGPRGIVAAVAAVVLGLGVAVAAPAVAAPAPVSFFVSPNGSDLNSGMSVTSAFHTLQQAQRAVRAVNKAAAGPITVTLASGDYRLTTPMFFTPADSGTPGAPTTWQAAPGAQPVISGGVRVTGWTRFDTAKNIWVAPVPTGLST